MIKLECLTCGVHVADDMEAFILHEERYGHWPKTIDPEKAKKALEEKD